MLKKLCMSSALLALMVSLTTLGFGQATAESTVKGNIAAYVTDPSGATVSDAKVTLVGPTGEKEQTTGSDGKVLFQVLTPGTYTVKIEKAGFKTDDVKSVEVEVGKTSVVNAKLEVGAASTTVEVTADAITVDTTSTANGANLNDQFYQSVPVGRGVTGLFYAASGVASGGGTGTANPSISGGTGLENNYIADGVSITDGGFGGIGVYSRIYGSLSTGINLSFVKEVDVKTGGFEAQYGKSTGGIVQIVTKSGTNQWHGVVGGYFAPQSLEKERLQSDTAGRFNLQGKILHQQNYDLDTQIGGPVIKNHLFVFGSFNPQWNTDFDQFAQYVNPSDLGTPTVGPGGVLNFPGPTQTHLGNYQLQNKVYSYAGKGTFRINDNHQFEASLFGDPTYGQLGANGNGGPQTASSTTFNKLQFGTRNLATRYNGTLSPTWLLNGSFSWGHNNLTDTPNSPGIYTVVDRLQRNPCGPPVFSAECTSQDAKLRGQFTRQGEGYHENTKGDNYGYNIDTSKTVNFLGQHNFSFGFNYARGHYDGAKSYTGATLPVTEAQAENISGSTDPTNPANVALVANGTTATFQMRDSASRCIENGGPKVAEIYIPGMSECADGGIGFYLRQDRGEFGSLNFKTTSIGKSLFANDNWSPSKYVSITAGLRWEQQHVQGVNVAYTFNDNWSPRVGLIVDPWGNRKTKVTANFGRYTENLPLDIAIRSLSAEYDFATTNWVPNTDGAGHALVNADGTLNFTNFSIANNLPQYLSGVSAQAPGQPFAKGTRSEYLDEYVVGFEHEFGNSGVIFSARYTDRRIKRIIEDNAALSPEAYQNNLNQNYTISNVNKAQDKFINPNQVDFATPAAIPQNCPDVSGPNGIPDGKVDAFDAFQATDSNGNTVTNTAGNSAFCVTNLAVAGQPGSDGIPDGFVDPQRKYQAMEIEVNKSMSHGWQMRANYRIAKLQGNYEGSFRNDNGQNDPNISSLFDFTRGDFNLLGQQFVSGVLNTDVRHLANGFVSYTFSNHAKGLTVGSSVHFQTGIPINNLYAHPAYQNAGEIPFCADDTTNCASARGSLGRTKDFGSVDYHMDYPFRVTEGSRLRLGVDLFNLTNQRTQLRVDQFRQSRFGVGNADFLKPSGIGPSAVNGNANPAYERPFYARFSVKWEF